MQAGALKDHLRAEAKTVIITTVELAGNKFKLKGPAAVFPIVYNTQVGTKTKSKLNKLSCYY